jgi:DNA repair exonuclease SbcCD ATPase subunit
MRILRARVRNYRVHADTEVSFRRDLTVIHGPNESGKSTLVEAIHRALFLSHRVGGQVRDAMLRMPSAGHPEVEVEFERAGESWTLWKRFGGSTAGEASLRDSRGRVLTGSDAEDWLARLVGTDPVSSGGGAARALRDRWGHLWVWQGTAGENLLSLPAGPEAYEHGKLVARLQEVGELSVQSALDREVVVDIESRWATVFTATGQVKAGSPLRDARKERDALTVQRDKVRKGMDERLEAQGLHAEATRRLEEAAAELPRAAARMEELEAALERALELDREINQEQALLEPRQAGLHGLEEDLRRLEADRATVAAASDELGPGEAALEALRNEQVERTETRAALRKQKEEIDEAVTELRAEVRRGEARSRQAHLASKVEELERSRAAAKERQSRLRALDEELEAIPPMTESDVRGLRRGIQTLEVVRAELRSLAAGIRAIRAGAPVELDGTPLAEGELRQITDRARLTVGDAVELELVPGGGASTQEVRARVEAAESQVTREMERLGVSDVEEAAAILAQREAIDRERSELGTGADARGRAGGAADGAQALEAALAELRSLEASEGLEPLEHPSHEAAGSGPSPDSGDPMPGGPFGTGDTSAAVQDLVTLRDRELQETRARLHASEAEASRLQTDLDQAQRELDALGTRIGSASETLQELQRRRADAESRMAVVLEKHDSVEVLEAAVETARERVEAITARIAELEVVRATLDTDALQAERAREQARRTRLLDAERQARDEQNRLKGRLESGEAADLDAESERLEAALEACQGRLVGLEREAAMLTLLRDLLEEEQNRMATEFSAPLQRGIEAYLSCILPEASKPALEYEAGRGFHDLAWRREDGVAWEFDALSGGAREQLMAALRLAMAEVLAGVGVDPDTPSKSGSPEGLPVVFDDSFVNADPKRMKGILRMLERAAERGLQVLVFTCDPAELEDEVKVEIRL